jgi:hypothetical protein
MMDWIRTERSSILVRLMANSAVVDVAEDAVASPN